MSSHRNINIEFCRVLAMFLIVSLHLTGRIFPLEEMESTSGDWYTSLLLACRSFFFIGVSFFAFISGYFGVKWNLKKAIKYELMAISQGGVIILYTFSTNQCMTPKIAFTLLTPLTSQVCWYYSAYILLMVIAPFMNDSLQRRDRRSFTILLGIMMLICYLGNFIYHRDSTQFMLLLAIYVLGQYLRRFPCTFLTKHSGKILIFSLLMNFTITFMASYVAGHKLLQFLENNYNPLLIVSAICIFIGAERKKDYGIIVKPLSLAAPYMFPLYILHADLLYSGSVDFTMLQKHVFIGSIVAISLIMILGTGFCWLREWCLGKMESKASDFLTMKIEKIADKI